MAVAAHGRNSPAAASEKSAPTFYNRHGDWFGWGCVAITLLCFRADCLHDGTPGCDRLKVRQLEVCSFGRRSSALSRLKAALREVPL